MNIYIKSAMRAWESYVSSKISLIQKFVFNIFVFTTHIIQKVSKCIYIYISASHFFHAVQILNINKPHFKPDAFRLFSLKTFSTVHCWILSAIKIVSANSKGFNLKGLNSRCLHVEGSHSIWRLNYYRESDTEN